MTDPRPDSYPEHTKQAKALANGSQAIGEFLDWLRDVEHVHLRV